MAKSYSLVFIVLFLLTWVAVRVWNKFPLIICNLPT